MVCSKCVIFRNVGVPEDFDFTYNNHISETEFYENVYVRVHFEKLMFHLWLNKYLVFSFLLTL